jgi:hypothetical protein
MPPTRTIGCSGVFAMLLCFSTESALAQISGYRGGSTYEYCRGSDTAQNPAGEGPFISASQSGSVVNVTWSGDGWNKWHFRWGHVGRNDERAFEYDGDTRNFKLNEPNSCLDLIFKIQGCVKYVIGSDRCSGFAQITFKSDPPRPSGPDTCESGFVWRETYPGDHACVSPQTRDQAAADNARRQLTPCVAPLVPRNAHSNDRFCVTQQVADDVRRDNAVVCKRLAKCP